MASNYHGHFEFSSHGIAYSAPDQIGVYYCGNLNQQGQLVPQYIGRARGEETTIRSRLNDHFNDGGWRNVTHFGFRVCNSATEAMTLEQQEIAHFNPTHNVHGKVHYSGLLEALLSGNK